MSRVLVALALAVAGVPACGGKGSSGPSVVAGAPAGKVTSLQGSVVARRGDAARPLALGDAVSGDDVIETGADGRVTITLDHNQVPFSLGPTRTQAVARSPAWSAPRGTAVAVTSGDRSGAAGRHAEREAADTLASAPGAAPAMAEPVPSAPAAPAPAAPTPPDLATLSAPAAAAPAEPGPRAGKHAPRGGGSDDGARELEDLPPPAPPPPPPPPDPLVTDVVGGGGGDVARLEVDVKRADDDPPPDKQRKIVGQGARGDAVAEVAPTGGGGGPGRLVADLASIDVSGALSSDVVLRKVRSRALTLRECAGPTPAATGFELTLTVAPSGAVTASQATGGADDVDRCLSRVVSALKFPTAAAPTTARLRLSLVAR